MLWPAFVDYLATGVGFYTQNTVAGGLRFMGCYGQLLTNDPV